jgi:cytosine/adenosine deaminase-related metal-dependent hydrolase
MATLLLTHADVLVTMDPARREIADGALFARDGVIEQVGPSGELPSEADTVLDMRGHVLIPGLVNTHHHLFQTLTRALPGAQDATLFDWLTTLYPIWEHLDGEAIYTSAAVGLAELALSGCTTASDHLYLFPGGATLDDEIRAARDVGLRFHASRGSMSLGRSKGGLPPDTLVEDEAAILRDTRRCIETFHDAGRYALTRVVVAPCSPFSVTPELMRESAELARSYGVHMHTHLAENDSDIDYSREHFGMRPGEYAESVGWVGNDVWHAHCVKLNAEEIGLFARTGTGVCHCPTSNMRLASGIMPLKAMRAAGVNVGLGVDGSASNDSSHLLAEARQALLLARVGGDPAALTARQALEVATLGGAAVLGRDDIGALAPGMACDVAAFDMRALGFAGARHDPVAALVFCAPPQASLLAVQGRLVVREGRLATMELEPLVERHNAIARRAVRGA